MSCKEFQKDTQSSDLKYEGVSENGTFSKNKGAEDETSGEDENIQQSGTSSDDEGNLKEHKFYSKKISARKKERKNTINQNGASNNKGCRSCWKYLVKCILLMIGVKYLCQLDGHAFFKTVADNIMNSYLRYGSDNSHSDVDNLTICLHWQNNENNKIIQVATVKKYLKSLNIAITYIGNVIIKEMQLNEIVLANRKHAAQLLEKKEIKIGGRIGNIISKAQCNEIVEIENQNEQRKRKNFDRLKKKENLLRTKFGDGVDITITENYESSLDERISETLKREQLRKKKSKDARKLSELLKEMQNTDLVFLMDVTGSMDPYIHEAKDQINNIIDAITSRYIGLKVRVGFIGYRDIDDKDKRYEILDFVEDIQRFKEFVGKIDAMGGGDWPEDVLGGMKKAIELSWKHNIRIIFHILDAPPHNKKYHDYDDVYPDGLPFDPKLTTLFAHMMTQDISYFIGKCSSGIDKMIQVFKSEFSSMLKPPGKEDWRIKDMNLENSINLLNTTVKIIHDTVATNTGKITKNAAKDIFAPKNYTIDKTPIEKVSMNSVNSLVYEPIELKSLSDLLDVENVLKVKEPVEDIVFKALHPFAEGNIRLAYYGKSNKEKETYTVLKSSKSTNPNHASLSWIRETIVQHNIANFIAKKFNKHLNLPDDKKIEYIVASMHVIIENNKTLFMTQEKYIRGSFIKFNNNIGYLNDEFTDDIEEEFGLIAQAFSHFSYTFTNKTFVIVDIQGFRVKNKFLLTDPAIHTKQRIFSDTDFGSQGMEQFSKTHTCNKYCAHLETTFKTEL